MKKPSVAAVALVIAVSAFLAGLGGNPVQAAQDNIYNTLAYRQLFALMNYFGYKVSLASDNENDIEPFSDREIIVWSLGEDYALIKLGDNGTRVGFYIYKLTNNTDVLQRVNQWNMNNYYARAHVDEGGSPVLEYELDTTGGVTEARIHDFFKTCVMCLASWMRDVVN